MTVTQPDLKQFTTFLQFQETVEETVEGLMLCGVPKLLEGHCPWWPGLPLYLLKLATEVPGLIFCPFVSAPVASLRRSLSHHALGGLDR